jgi:hypothetical protein
MMKSFRIFLFLGACIIINLLLLTTSCKHDADISKLPEVCFSRDILPIYSNNCAISGCHTAGAGGERFSLANYADIRNTVTPFKPEQSESYKAIVSTGGEGHMPPGQLLSKGQRTLIRVWIEQGADETTCTP